jgi:hypothetical protein
MLDDNSQVENFGARMPEKESEVANRDEDAFRTTRVSTVNQSKTISSVEHRTETFLYFVAYVCNNYALVVWKIDKIATAEQFGANFADFRQSLTERIRETVLSADMWN